MIKISGRHKSVPRELKRALKQALPADTKIVMNDICSCRHAYSPGTLRVTAVENLSIKLRGYFGSGIVNFYVTFTDQANMDEAMAKLDK